MKRRCTVPTLFVAATSQNDGKTTLCLGLLESLRRFCPHIGYIKPVGHRYEKAPGEVLDDDSVLISSLYGNRCSVKDMSPVVITSGFTREYLESPEGKTGQFQQDICNSFDRLAEGANLMLVEGTGHAGVGSVIDLNNAQVARLLKTPVVIVATGGIGTPLDEIVLNQLLFEKHGIPICGVVVNKVIPEKMGEVREYLGRALSRLALPLLGVIPFVPNLAWPTMDHVLAATKASVRVGSPPFHSIVSSIMVGAMTPQNAIKYLKDRCLLVTPGDREDVILACLTVHQSQPDAHLSGIILTGGYSPGAATMQMLAKVNLPVLLTKDDTYSTAAILRTLVPKIHAGDSEKIVLAKELVNRHVDVTQIWKSLQELHVGHFSKFWSGV